MLESQSSYINIATVKLNEFLAIWYHNLVSVIKKWEIVSW